MRNPTGEPDAGSAASPSSSVPSPTDSKRRRFLFSLSASGMGAAAAALAQTPALAAVVTPAAETERRDAGYRETEHVRSYYRTARL